MNISSHFFYSLIHVLFQEVQEEDDDDVGSEGEGDPNNDNDDNDEAGWKDCGPEDEKEEALAVRKPENEEAPVTVRSLLLEIGTRKSVPEEDRVRCLRAFVEAAEEEVLKGKAWSAGAHRLTSPYHATCLS